MTLASVLLRLVERAQNQSAKFKKDDGGNITFFIVLTFLTITMFAGLSVDIMRYERARAMMQTSLDNASLAAASMRQTGAALPIVEKYMEVAQLPNGYEVSIEQENITLTERLVHAKAELTMNTVFMQLAGVDQLDLKVESTALERIPNVEVSLILDVSGSMGDYDRLVNLKPAAKTFVSTVLASNASGEDRASINLIPYSMQVNAGKRLFEEVNGSVDHNHSYCAEFSDSVFYSATVPSQSSVDQMIHQAWYNDYWTTGADFDDYEHTSSYNCRTEDAMPISVMSKDETALRNQIEAFTAGGNTSIDLAMKWGTMLLDPSANSIIQNLANTQLTPTSDPQSVSSSFSARPTSYSDENTLKIAVVMTDGQNTTQYKVNSSYRNGYSDVYHNDADGFHFDYGNSNDRLTWAEAWARVPLWHYMNQADGSNSWSTYWTYKNASAKDTRLSNICSAAKDKGVVIFAIAYDATTDGQAAMQDCATSQSFYYVADTSNIGDIFAEIGGVVEKLKLTN